MTLELSNVANLPITIYPEMKIGQLSFVQMSEPAEKPYGSGGARVEVPGAARAHAEPVLEELRGMSLVTGANGFVGRHAVRELVTRGAGYARSSGMRPVRPRSKAPTASSCRVT